MLDDLSNGLRAKSPSKPRPKKATPGSASSTPETQGVVDGKETIEPEQIVENEEDAAEGGSDDSDLSVILAGV